MSLAGAVLSTHYRKQKKPAATDGGPGFSTTRIVERSRVRRTAPPLKAVAPWVLSLRNTRWDGHADADIKKRGRRPDAPVARTRLVMKPNFHSEFHNF